MFNGLPASFKRAQSRFTLIELLVVVAIISILAAMLAPSLQRALQLSIQLTCADNLRQLNICGTMYRDDYNDFLPPCYRPDWSDALAPYAGIDAHSGSVENPWNVAWRTSSAFLGTVFDCKASAEGNANARGEPYLSANNYGMNFKTVYLPKITSDSWAEQQRTPLNVRRVKFPKETRYLGDSKYGGQLDWADPDPSKQSYGHWEPRHMGGNSGNLLLLDGHVVSVPPIIYIAYRTYGFDF